MKYAVGIREGNKIMFLYIKREDLKKVKNAVQMYNELLEGNLQKFKWMIIKEVLFDGALIELLKKADPNFNRFLEETYLPQRKTLYYCYIKAKKRLDELDEAKERVEKKYSNLEKMPWIHKENNRALYEEEKKKIKFAIKEIEEDIFYEGEKIEEILEEKRSLDGMLIDTIPKSIRLEIVKRTLKKIILKYSKKKVIISIDKESYETFPKIALYKIKNNEYRLIK